MEPPSIHKRLRLTESSSSDNEMIERLGKHFDAIVGGAKAYDEAHFTTKASLEWSAEYLADAFTRIDDLYDEMRGMRLLMQEMEKDLHKQLDEVKMMLPPVEEE